MTAVLPNHLLDAFFNEFIINIIAPALCQGHLFSVFVMEIHQLPFVVALPVLLLGYYKH